MKEFNLEQALAGKPVMLRNGKKAFVKYVVPDKYRTRYRLVGFIEQGDNELSKSCWTENGRERISGNLFDEDIVGMWQEQRQKIKIEIPKPVHKKEIEDLDEIFLIGFDNAILMRETIRKVKVMSDGINNLAWKYVNAGLAFASREDAEEFLKAIKNAAEE